MRKDWKYILYLTLAFGIFLIIKLSGPKEFDWTPTYASEDKNPFGAFVLKEMLPSFFKGNKIQITNKTLYELKDSLKPNQNIFILSHRYSADKEDVKVLLKHVHGGGTAFIGAENFYGALADTLWVTTNDYLFEGDWSNARRDTSYLKYVNPRLDTTMHFVFRRDNIHNYLSLLDTGRYKERYGKIPNGVKNHPATSVIVENDFHKPLMVKVEWGKGSIIMCSSPLAFTNIYALKGDHHQFLATALSYLPPADVCWLEYYSVGRLESRTPLRFILTHEPLAWAYYISLIALLLFMVFEAKRKQRIIPVIPRLTNSSLEFVSTVGNLYFNRGDHKNIADKKILFFFDQLRGRYLINPNNSNDNFIPRLAKKAGKSEEQVTELFNLIRRLQNSASIGEKDLRDLNDQIEKFMG